MMITFVVAALAFQWGISTVSADCPKLPSIQFASPTYRWCTTESSVVNRTCTFVCARGYALENDHNRVFFRFMCQANGTWSGKVYRCVDTRPPRLHCPDDITVTARKGSPSEVVSWKIDVNDNQVDPNATVTLHSSHVSPYNFTIGRHEIYVTATDKVGNQASCQFSVIIRDLEPPTCSFCPDDIVREGKGHMERVSWDRPVCSDNSHLPVMIAPSRHNGGMLSVPGTYKIQYTVEDHAYPKRNRYTGCSFTITLKRPRCPMYPRPKNGALVCVNRTDGSQAFCGVACESGTDFVSHPALLYICDDSGQWQRYSPFEIGNPEPDRYPLWPNCEVGAGPSVVKIKGFSTFFFDGNQPRSKVVLELKQNFLKFAKGPDVPPWYCLWRDFCKSENVHVDV